MNNPTIEQIGTFLRAVDSLFPVPLSHKQDLTEFSKKLFEKATLCTIINEDKIVSMVAGYTECVTDGLAYISIVGTLKHWQGKGYAKTLLQRFFDICREKRLRGIHLYALKTNVSAVKMYMDLGFTEWKTEQEPRPHDLHLLYLLEE